ncbi:hypothetical protein L3X38_037246 [Prunus dulcis]|uniref:Uncharacterized protein n=1 Tax=Prunus dulcis TaxID=3755 RepID=A0AAD4V497_PRUDU|nr:hypothetical protein L3X38_037246 [Prunus dulcis]
MGWKVGLLSLRYWIRPTQQHNPGEAENKEALTHGSSPLAWLFLLSIAFAQEETGLHSPHINNRIVRDFTSLSWLFSCSIAQS